MVSLRQLLRRWALWGLMAIGALFLSGCATSAKVTVAPGFTPPPERDRAYVIPFSTALVPEAFSEAVFNDFVDLLNRNRRQTGIGTFTILKEDAARIDQDWLSRQFYLTGDIWSYVEDSGCCSTNIRVRARAAVFEPGKREPSVEIFLPLETFFDHDKSTIDRERDTLARNLARELTRQILGVLTLKK